MPDAPVASTEGDPGDPAEGEWLFKQGDVVLGPVAASVLVERLEQGELDGDTPIGREAGDWRPLSEVPYFAELHASLVEKRRRAAERRAAEAKARRARTLRVVAGVAIALVPFFAGALLGRTLMVKRPWDDSEEWLQRAPPLVDLPPKPPETKKPPEPPPEPEPPADDERVASADDDESATEPPTVKADDDDKRTAKKGKKARANKKGKRGKERLARADKRDAKAAAKRDDKKRADARKSGGADDKPAGKLPETLTSAQVTQGLTKGKAGIGACLKAEAGRNPDMPSVVTLMFTVTEEGRAINIKLKEREVRDGPLSGCLVNVVSKLRWPKFTGERKNAEFPFRIRR